MAKKKSMRALALERIAGLEAEIREYRACLYTTRLRVDNWKREYATRKRFGMWHYPEDDLGKLYCVRGLKHRVAAAEQLGYEVRLIAKPTGLHVEYVGVAPPLPILPITPADRA